jgi:hypothetical protein
MSCFIFSASLQCLNQCLADRLFILDICDGPKPSAVDPVIIPRLDITTRL